MLIELTLTNAMTGQQFYFTVQVFSWTQFYNRLSVLMEQLAVIEQVSPSNISHLITNAAIAA